MASCQLLPSGIDCARHGNSPLCFEVVASPSFQHQSQADGESHKSFNKEHNFLGDRAAATVYRHLVNALLQASNFLQQSKIVLSFYPHALPFNERPYSPALTRQAELLVQFVSPPSG